MSGFGERAGEAAEARVHLSHEVRVRGMPMHDCPKGSQGKGLSTFKRNLTVR